MREPCNVEALDALAHGELPLERSAAVEAHVATCPTCRAELAWLRSERQLLSRRNNPSPDRLWAGIEQRIQGGGVVPIPENRQHKRGFGAGLALALGAAAAALVGGLTLALRPAFHRTHGNQIPMSRPLGEIPNPPEPPLAPLAPLAPLPPLPPLAPLPPLPPLPPLHHHDHEGDETVSARAPVSGTVTVQLETVSADLHVTVGATDSVSVHVEDSSIHRIELAQRSGRVEVRFDGAPALRDGTVTLEVPRGTRLELTTVSGDVLVDGVAGDLKLRSTSGDAVVRAAARTDIATTSGDVHLDGISGALVLRTSSGDARVSTAGDAPQLDFASASGDLDWSGRCGAGCRVATQSSSGDVRLRLSRDSSFRLRYLTNSGDLADSLNTVGDDEHRRRYGNGAGSIECRTSTGDLELTSR